MFSSMPLKEVNSMGIKPIEYQPWKGKRTSYIQRVLVIIKNIFKNKITSGGIIALLIIGGLIAHFPNFLTLVFMPTKQLEPNMMINYFNNLPFYFFAIILGAVVTSDIISDDINSNSFVLYFSRPIKPINYLIGKYTGAFMIISMFTLLPTFLYGVAAISLQSGSNYIDSLKILGLTILAGILYSIVITGYGTMLSSFTEKKTYAGGGTFISFIVTPSIGEIFSNFDYNWKLVNPMNLLNYSLRIIYGKDLPNRINSTLFGALMILLIALPIVISLYRLHQKAVGK